MLTWFRKKMKTIMIVVAVLFGASMFYGLGYRGLSGGMGRSGPSNVLAKVNGQDIDPVRYHEMLNRVMQGMGGNAGIQELAFVENLALGQTVDFTLLLGEARKRVRVSGAEIDSAVDGIMRQQNVPSKRELETALKRMGLSMGKFRDLISDDIAVQKLNMKLREEVKVTPDDLREIRASHILLSTEADAKLVQDKLKQGIDFAALAKQYSSDAGTAAKGGDLGYFTTGMMVPDFDKAAFALKVGEVSGIVKTQFGFHIIKLIDSRLRKFPGKVKDIEAAALQDKQEKTFRTWYSEIQKNAKVEIINSEMKANNYRFRGMVKEAIDEYKKAILESPANPYLHVFLGDTYMQTGQQGPALLEYEDAVRVEGGNPELYLILGKAYDTAGQKGQAAEQYKKASLIAGDNKALHERLLKLFEAMKLNSAAAQERSEIKRIEKKEKFEQELKGGH